MGLASIVFWKYQKNKKGESPIFIRVIEDRKPRYVKTGLMATEEDWDIKENLFKTKYRRAEDVMKAEIHRQNNELLKKKLNDTESLIKDLILEDNVFSSEQVKQEIVKAKNTGKQSLFTYIDLIVEEKKKIGSLGTAKCYYDLKNSLRTFIEKEGRTDLAFRDMNMAFLKKYEAYFKSRGTTDNGISFYMRTLRAVFNRAIAEGVCKKDLYPFNSYKISHLSTKTIKRAITKADIELIRNFECETGSQLHRSKNIFLFSYYNRGINFSDIAMLKWENINENRLIYTRLKTGKFYNMHLLDPALDILSFYRNATYRGDISYIFPILDEHRHNTPGSIQNRVHKVLGQTNKDLKFIGKQLSIATPLTTYVARHSYATVLKRSGVSTSVISEAMGHDSERTTQIYLDSFENDVLDEASKLLL
jgi:integrase